MSLRKRKQRAFSAVCVCPTQRNTRVLCARTWLSSARIACSSPPDSARHCRTTNYDHWSHPTLARGAAEENFELSWHEELNISRPKKKNMTFRRLFCSFAQLDKHACALRSSKPSMLVKLRGQSVGNVWLKMCNSCRGMTRFYFFFASGNTRTAKRGGGGAYSSVACPSHLTIDHASLSRQGTVPTSNRGTANIWALVTLLPYIT